MSDAITRLIDRGTRFFTHDVWRSDMGTGRLKAVVTGTLQLCVMVTEGFIRDQLLLRASALTYVTALSIIPVLAVTISIVKLFDPGNTLVTTAVEYLAAVSPEAQEKILELVAGANIAGLGTLGAGMLFVSSIMALRYLETTLNIIWGVRKERSLMRRFADYLAVLIVVPMFMGIAMSMGTAVAADPLVDQLLDVPVFAMFYQWGLTQTPKLFLLVGFTFVYWFFPNTNVHFVSALLGGAIAAVLFSVAQVAYVDLNVGVARYSALFGGFAALPLLLVWLYVCWAVTLLGAEVSFAYQNLSHYRLDAQAGDMGSAEMESLGIRIAVEVGRAFRDGTPVPTAEDLSMSLDASVRAVRDLLHRLESAGVLRQCVIDEREEGYQLARPAEKISMADLLVALRGGHMSGGLGSAGECGQAVGRVIDELERTLAGFAQSRTLAQVLDDVPEALPATE